MNSRLSAVIEVSAWSQSSSGLVSQRAAGSWSTKESSSWGIRGEVRTFCASVNELRAFLEEVSWDLEELLDLVGHDGDCEVVIWAGTS